MANEAMVQDFVRTVYDAYGADGDKFFLAKKEYQKRRVVGDPLVKMLTELEDHFRGSFAHPARRQIFVEKCLELPDDHPFHVAAESLFATDAAEDGPLWVAVVPPKAQPKVAVHALAISSDGKTVLAGEYGAVSVWSLETGEQLSRSKLPDGTQEVRRIACLPDGTVRVATSQGPTFERAPEGRRFKEIASAAEPVEEVAETPGALTLDMSDPVVRRVLDETGAVVGEFSLRSLHWPVWLHDTDRGQFVIADSFFDPPSRPVTLVRRRN